MSDTESGDVTTAVILDYLPHGKSGDDRPSYQKPAIAYALTEATFDLVECTLTEGADLNIGDRVTIKPQDEQVESVTHVEYDDLTGASRAELEYVVRDIVENNEQRFVDFYNDAQPISLRLHQLNLLPGIGKKLRNNILEQRKRGPFESFEELEERVKGLHKPKEVLVERILEELHDDDLKYKAFVRREN
ncbi:DUF655 domain-containing protein [Haladaptatus sp. DJG-WS-42]|uniref:DUF655 domain-containing protein n=1 Tax=Haladaptatus sp. DJG-WS-42 TaxID=3120516 RepID=UPI0030D1D1AB